MLYPQQFGLYVEKTPKTKKKKLRIIRFYALNRFFDAGGPSLIRFGRFYALRPKKDTFGPVRVKFELHDLIQYKKSRDNVNNNKNKKMCGEKNG